MKESIVSESFISLEGLCVRGDSNMKVYICDSGCCPAVETVGDSVLIGEDENVCRLSREEWNNLVDKIQSGVLHKL